MKHITEYRAPGLIKSLAAEIRNRSRTPVRLMEFCGGHTATVFKYGLRQLLPDTVEMVSGPGCPVCVTDQSDLDRALALARIPDVILTTFGDLMRVPGSSGSLQTAAADGADVRVVYSTLEALALAKKNPGRPVIFIGVGFETTAPTIAAAIIRAKTEGLSNFHALSLHKTCPPVIDALLSQGQLNLHGLICPGHVSTITGTKAWAPLAEKHTIPCVVSGFEPADILQSVLMLVNQIESRRAEVENAYTRGCTWEGNVNAHKIMDTFFITGPAVWRGLGPVADSGLKIRKEYAVFDAERVFDVSPPPEVSSPAGCICGDILRGVKTPPDCPLFRSACTPSSPVGPCMVSSEGACGTYYAYSE